jgi:EmrB/QacA subfamily drug resistance transporter
VTEGADTARRGNAPLTLAAMTLANSMILVDQTAVPIATPEVIASLDGSLSEGQWVLTANVLPLAALLVFGGRLGDLLGLRRVFLAGALLFALSTGVAGGAQDMVMLIAARVTQGIGAALMMPTALAIVSASYPAARRGQALGILAGASAFFAALGPVLGGLLTSIEWRLVFLVNVVLALVTIVLTLRAAADFRPAAGASRIDYAGTFLFALGIATLVFGLSQVPDDGWGAASAIGPMVAAVFILAAFVVVELRVQNPLLEFRLFRHLNFLAANISQLLAGAIELGLGFLLPYYLLLVVGVEPAVAGIALIPGTVPIVLAGPLAGRAFDRIGGRRPLVFGFLVLAASGVALALGAGAESVGALIPGLLLQGLGLGVVLTVNDPTGLSAVPPESQGEAAGTINTTEQLGGAIGIAALIALEVGRVSDRTMERLAARGIDASDAQIERFRDFILEAEQTGLRDAPGQNRPIIREALADNVAAHVDGFQLIFYVSAGIALAGAVACLLLVRRADRRMPPVFGRRSRWVLANVGATPGLTRQPPAGGTPAQPSSSPSSGRDRRTRPS